MEDREQIKKELEQLFNTLDLEKLLKDAFLGGFDTYEDYEKYGDIFIKIKETTPKEVL